MDRILLERPEGGETISMDKNKYAVLSKAILACLSQKQLASLDDLVPAVDQYLHKSKQKLTGKLEWNLFWVTGDMVSKNKIKRNSASKPVLYFI